MEDISQIQNRDYGDQDNMGMCQMDIEGNEGFSPEMVKLIWEWLANGEIVHYPKYDYYTLYHQKPRKFDNDMDDWREDYWATPFWLISNDFRIRVMNGILYVERSY